MLVTGSAGHLGEGLLRTLRGNQVEATGLDIKPSPFTDLVGSIADRDFVRPAMAGARTVFHAATLHKPHVATHSKSDFVETNIQGTLVLLEEAVRAGVESFIFTSTTSVFGDALRPPVTEPAAWVTEEVTPIPKNIYGVTKTAAEDLCQLFHRKHGLNCLVLRTSRFFLEEDDNPKLRAGFSDDNTKANEFLYRRVDLEDVVTAHLLAAERASKIGFGRYIISATTPFSQQHLARLRSDAPKVLWELHPEFEDEYRQRGWSMFPGIDRVYVNQAARTDLGWNPKYDFARVLACLREKRDWRSPLALAVGNKGYHEMEFDEGPYPVEK